MVGVRRWFRSGTPWIWLTASAVSVSILTVFGLIALIAARGLAHFWPAEVQALEVASAPGETRTWIGEITDRERIPVGQYLQRAQPFARDRVPEGTLEVERILVKTGNRDANAPDFRWVATHLIEARSAPGSVAVFERTEWGNAYGFLQAVREAGEVVARGTDAWPAFEQRLARAKRLRTRIESIESDAIGDINYALEQLRLEERELELYGAEMSAASVQARRSEVEAERSELQQRYQRLEGRLDALKQAIRRDAIELRIMGGGTLAIPLAEILQVWQPNQMSTLEKLGFYAGALWRFLSEDPREANTEGGIFPAIFGTVLMVLLMSVLVTPFGVVAAVYLREYARQGAIVRLVRIAVNNLAGVPSIVYGVFGLGFFVYFIGGGIDQLFFQASLPSPTFGTPGLLWASLTLALLTLPVVIVSTEEGLSRIPRSQREGSLALGATRAETLRRVILPMASPSIMTGVILAIARAAGEVAPLMLVGVVKLAPKLPVDEHFPFLHLERKFMHLGFHIYDVGFQSPNVDAARPVVYATSFLLIALIIVLNLTAILLRNRLRERYRAIQG